jgi:adenine-specific DNA-methyltransferase
MQSPYLNWTGKAEKTSFEVDTVSLHVHERIDPATILQALRHNLQEKQAVGDFGDQFDLFDNNVFAAEPLREAVEFYKHEKGWANRMISGDSLLVMNSLLQKESMAGQVQMIYIDPHYGIKYGSNFQPFVNKRDVTDRSDEDLTQEPEMIKAFRDTWELGIHSYLTYLRDRLLLARELLADSGSCFVQISDENVHHVREIMDEVFEKGNFVGLIAFKKTGYQESGLLPSNYDYLVWYARDKTKIKYRQLYVSKLESSAFVGQDLWCDTQMGERRRLSSVEQTNLDEIIHQLRVFRHKLPEGAGASGNTLPFEWRDKEYRAKEGKHFSTTISGMKALAQANRFISFGKNLRFVNFLDDHPVTPITSNWADTVVSGFSDPQTYVVQTTVKALERCLLMTSDPGDLALDITCGSGTTAFVAEKMGPSLDHLRHLASRHHVGQATFDDRPIRLLPTQIPGRRHQGRFHLQNRGACHVKIHRQQPGN